MYSANFRRAVQDGHIPQQLYAPHRRQRRDQGSRDFYWFLQIEREVEGNHYSAGHQTDSLRENQCYHQ